jgi:glycosyltransferase involved in cell wall biosynthesis
MRHTYRDASCVVGIGGYVERHLKGAGITSFRQISETALDVMPPEILRVKNEDDLRLLFVGRVVRTKGARDVIRALNLLHDLPVSLDVVGDGYDRPACEELVAAFGLQERVRFHGWQPKENVLAFYRAADVFVFPSYREAGGNVTYEAMGASLPCIVADRGGPTDVVDENSAILVTPTTPDEYAASIAEAVRQLCMDPERRLRMGRASRSRLARMGLWGGKIRLMEDVYRQVMVEGQHPKKLWAASSR